MERRNPLSHQQEEFNLKLGEEYFFEILLVLENFIPNFTNFKILHFLVGLFGRSFKKDFKTSTRCCSAPSCLKVNLSCWRDILQAPRIYGIVQTSL